MSDLDLPDGKARDESVPMLHHGARIAIGVGFRKRCTAEALAALVRHARDRLAARHPALTDAPAVLVTIAEKDRPAFRDAAAMLGLAVVVLPKAALLGTEDRISTVSEAARACFGVPSVAEAAALAAAGPGARLLLARVSIAEAACAIAGGAGLENAETP